ncbi:TPA: hypothetical protein NKZ51_004524 [Vibrio parahaemolyticus]|nr:hypothetical protein [Vibrio parahaemolyticus]
MNNVMIGLMRASLLVLVVGFIGGGAFLGFAYGLGNPYTPALVKVLAIGGGALVGLVLAGIVTGVCYLLLNINDNLERLAAATAAGNPDQ